MSKAEQRLDEDRANRRAARGLFDGALAQVKADLAARGVGRRVKDTITGEAVQSAEQAIAVARANKGVVAGTIAALALWMFRNPLIAMGHRLFSAQPDADSDKDPDEEHQP